MSKDRKDCRDQFAAAALMGLTSRTSRPYKRALVDEAFDIADAMMTESEVRENAVSQEKLK